MFSVSITDDSILEDDEAFNLIINATSLPDKVTVGDHSHATVIIMDNDGKLHTIKYDTNKHFTLIKTIH